MRNLFIIYGGIGSEREVSLYSGKNVVDTLRNEGIACEEIIIGIDKRFSYNGNSMSEEEGISFLQKENALVFQVVHGAYGEDGELVKKLETASVACIGSDSAVLAVTIDKYKTEKLLEVKGITTPHSVIVTRKERETDMEKLQGLTLLLFIKPNKEGSSIGVKKVTEESEVRDSIKEVLIGYEEVLVQRFLSGREFTCGVVEIAGEEVALIPSEVILTKGDLFGCKEVTPAEIDEETTKKIQDLALLVHKVFGCKDISRTDMRMDENNELVVLEINTVPGMTKTSFIPEELKASSYTLSQFIQGMLQKYSDNLEI
jgi:D-alanine-D-alanine ligase